MRFVIFGAGAIGGGVTWSGDDPVRPAIKGEDTQSLARGSGAIETDYLNGEIVLEGRLRGGPTPVNDALCRLAVRVAQAGGAPGSVAAADVPAAAA
jgi:2-dehydropantoate 2-reductase